MSSVPADIESSLEVCEILHLEVQTLSKDAARLDEEISALRRKKVELEETIEGYKNRLLSGTRHLKSLNVQRLQAEYATQESEYQIAQLLKAFDSKAMIYGRLEVEAMLLEREVAWKREDIAKLHAKQDDKRRAEELRLRPKIEERNALKEELARVRANVRKLQEEEEKHEQRADQAERNHELEKLKREVLIMENRNEAYRRRMRNALEDLSAKVDIKRRKINRFGQNGRVFSQTDVRGTPVKSNLDRFGQNGRVFSQTDVRGTPVKSNLDRFSQNGRVFSQTDVRGTPVTSNLDRFGQNGRVFSQTDVRGTPVKSNLDSWKPDWNTRDT